MCSVSREITAEEISEIIKERIDSFNDGYKVVKCKKRYEKVIVKWDHPKEEQPEFRKIEYGKGRKRWNQK